MNEIKIDNVYEYTKGQNKGKKIIITSVSERYVHTKSVNRPQDSYTNRPIERLWRLIDSGELKLVELVT